jgi:hypothetical protein
MLATLRNINRASQFHLPMGEHDEKQLMLACLGKWVDCIMAEIVSRQKWAVLLALSARRSRCPKIFF